MSFGGTSAVSKYDLLSSCMNSAVEEFESWGSDDWAQYNQEVESYAQEINPHGVSPEIHSQIQAGDQAFVHLSDIVTGMLTVDGQPFKFDGRQYLKGLYDQFERYPVGCRNLILIAGRQVEKSTTQAAKSVSLGMVNKAWKTLYVAPRFDQVTVFSQQRFKPMCEDSPQVMGTWVQPGRTLWQVGAKQFTNGSFFNFRSCFLSADNARGITADHLMIDEIQDIVPEAIPVLEQCQSHTRPEIRYNTYAGTAKGTSNIISRRYRNSCMFEWLVPCGGFENVGCRHWNIINEDIIQDDKYACSKCGRGINPHIGEWVAQRTELLDTRWGFRISQPMVPFKFHKDIVDVRDDPNTPRSSYLNEVLGLPYDEGTAGLTEADMQNACQEYGMLDLDTIKREFADRGLPVFAGVDYGTGEGVNPSYTVLTIGTLLHSGVFKVLWMRKLKNREAALAKQPELLDKFCRQAGVRWWGADYGFGAQNNARLASDEFRWDRVSGPNVLMEFQYVASKCWATWDQYTYRLDRNQAINRVIDAIKRPSRAQGIVFFNYGDFGDFLDDFTTVTMEYNETTNRTRWNHSLPDDALHSVLYAYHAAMQFHGVLVPTVVPKL